MVELDFGMEFEEVDSEEANDDFAFVDDTEDLSLNNQKLSEVLGLSKLNTGLYFSH